MDRCSHGIVDLQSLSNQWLQASMKSKEISGTLNAKTNSKKNSKIKSKSKFFQNGKTNTSTMVFINLKKDKEN
jgi:hypothetical protein